MIKRIDVVFVEEKPAKGRMSKWLGWLKRPKRTSDAILKEVIEEPLYGAHKDVYDLNAKGEQVMADLTTLGCHDMDVFDMEISKLDEEKDFIVGEPIEAVCKVTLKESKRLNLGAKLSAEGESAVGETELKMKNYFGRMEEVSGSVAGTQGYTIYNFSVEKPIIKRPFGTRFWRFGAGNTHTDNRALSSHSVNEINVWTSYMQSDHNLMYQAIYRDVMLDRTATEPMLDEGGHSIKSAVKYTWSRDSRNHPLMPTSGRRVRSSVELAGLLGNIRHLKLEADYSKHTTLSENMSLQFIARAGAIFSLGGRSHIADRFFFGGLHNPFYGFKMHGAGPRMAHNSLGGDAFWSTSVHSHIPIASTALGDIHAHAYAQAGNCVSANELNALFATRHASAPIRATVGAGIAFTTGVGLRFDLLYTVPISSAPKDKLQPLSFGASFSFG